MPDQRDVLLVYNWKFLPASYSQLPLDQILSSNHLCYRVLDLQTSIHLHEIELICHGVKDKLYRSSINIAHCFGCLNCGLTNLGSNCLSNLRGSLLNNFLMTSLDRAVSLIKVDIVSMLITEDLKLDMSWLLDVFLNNHMLIIKTLESLSLC